MSKIDQFTPLSIQLTSGITKTERKAQGIYFTPKTIVNHLISIVLPLFSQNTSETNFRVLEPSCGSCEFVQALDSILVDTYITCVELNETIYQKIIQLSFKNNVEFIKGNFIELDENNSYYDLIIGNPPYFVCKKDDVPKKYMEFVVGRPNMFGLFIIHSLKMLKENGILAFVIPKSFLNSAYYAIIRNYIKQNCVIINVIDYASMNDFIDTEQSTFGLILRKLDTDNNPITVSECNYSLLINGNYVFSPNKDEFRAYLHGATTLKQMGFSVKTGTIVWNEKKDLLTDNETDTLLLYNTNITNDNKLKLTKFKNDEKGQYIQAEGSIEPIIVVNRGNGNAKYNFKYALIELDKPFIIENHLNIIYSQEKRPKPQLLEMYRKITTSFQNPKTKSFIELFFGNNALSKTELETVLPIYL
jgi:adenine-specific DNA-methyltransferase